MDGFLKRIFGLPGFDNDTSGYLQEIPMKANLRTDDTGPISFAYTIHSIFDVHEKEVHCVPTLIRPTFIKRRNDPERKI